MASRVRPMRMTFVRVMVGRTVLMLRSSSEDTPHIDLLLNLKSSKVDAIS